MKSSDNDSGKIISLSTARKTRRRDEKEQLAAENRIRYGRTGVQKKRERLEKQRHDKAHRDTEMTDK